QTINRFPVGHVPRRPPALQKCRHRAHPHQRNPAPLQKIPPRKLQPPHALATFMAHVLSSLKLRRPPPNFQGSFLIPAKPPAPQPPPLPPPPSLPASPDHPTSPATPADYQAVS